MNEQIQKKYKEIVDKLGFEPKDYKTIRPENGFTEDDNRKSPFSILSIEELRFLRDNNLLQKGL